MATVAYYGPDDKVATKIAVGIISGEDQEPVAMERWISEGDGSTGGKITASAPGRDNPILNFKSSEIEFGKELEKTSI